MEDQSHNCVDIVNHSGITVAVISYNHGKKIFSCIDSILSQTYQSIDLVIVDDYSCDFIREEVEKYIRQKNTGSIKRCIVKQLEKHCNTVLAYKHALELSQGEYILFVAGDDVLADEDVLQKAYKKLQKEDTDILQGTACLVRPHEELVLPCKQCISAALKREPIELLELTLHAQNHQLLCIQAAFFRTKVLLENNVFSNEYHFAVDWLLYSLLLKNNIRFSSQKLRISALQDEGAYRVNAVGNVYIRRAYLQEASQIIREYGIKRRLQEISEIEAIALARISYAFEYRAVRIFDWGYYNLTDRLSWLREHKQDIATTRYMRFCSGESKASFKYYLFLTVATLMLWKASMGFPSEMVKNILLLAVSVFFLLYMVLFKEKDCQGYTVINFYRIARFLTVMVIMIILPSGQITAFLRCLVVLCAIACIICILCKINARLYSRAVMKRIRKRWQQ